MSVGVISSAGIVWRFHMQFIQALWQFSDTVKSPRENWRLEDVKSLQPEERQHIWLARVSPVPGGTFYNLGNGSVTWNEAPNKLAEFLRMARRGGHRPGSLQRIWPSYLFTCHASTWHFWISDNLSHKSYAYIISNENVPLFRCVSPSHARQLKLTESTGRKMCMWVVCDEWACWKQQLEAVEGTWFLHTYSESG